MVIIKTKKVYHADYDYYTYYDYYTIPIGIAQLNAFSCAKKSSNDKYLPFVTYVVIMCQVIT